jgi:hypothetical protein
LRGRRSQQPEPDESEAQREAKRNLIVSLVTGLAATSASLDPATANSAAGAAVDNNWLATQQLVQAEKEYSEADLVGKTKVVAKWAYIYQKQEVLTRFGIGKGLVQAGWGDVEGLAQFLLNPVDGINGIRALINNPEAREQFSDGMINDLNEKLDRVKDALENGGDERAVQLGQDIGEIVWQVGSIATGVGTAAKGGVALAKVGIKVGAEGLEKMADMAKIAKAEVSAGKPVQWSSVEGAYSKKLEGGYGPGTTTVNGKVVENAGEYSVGAKGLGQTGGAVTSGTTLDLFSATRGKDLSKLTNQQVGDLGEDISKVFLRDNNHTDIFAVQNPSGNGIDIVSRTPDGRLAFTEVKTSRTGNVGDLSVRQQNMTTFIEDVLGQAASRQGRYKSISVAEQQQARQMLREFRRAPENVSGNLIGVDLQGEVLRVSPWARN